MKSATLKRKLVFAVIIFLLAFGTCFGNFIGYARGFRDGQTNTNSWWIGKQSRYYDSNEVEEQRQQKKLDWF